MNATTTMTTKKYITSFDEYINEMKLTRAEAVTKIPEMIPEIEEQLKNIKFLWNAETVNEDLLFMVSMVQVFLMKAYSSMPKDASKKVFENAIDSVIDSIDNEHFEGDDEYRMIVRRVYSDLELSYRLNFGERYRNDYVPKF